MYRNGFNAIALVCALVVALTFAPAAQSALVHQWTFNDGTSNDSIGTANGTLSGLASISAGQLYIPGNGKMLTSAIGTPIGTKTLLVWTTLSNPAVSTRGSALTMETNVNGDTFDAIVYGEASAQKWMAGSDYFNRTQNPQIYGTVEDATTPVMIAVAYAADNSITLYRNDQLYGSYTKGALVNYGGSAVVQIGPRHGNHSDVYNGYIDEARIYDTALSLTDIRAIYAAGPVPYVPPSARTWAAAPSTGLWSTPGNWVENVAPAAGNILTFSSSSQTTVTNDLNPAGVWLAGIVFDPSAGSYIINENTPGTNQIRLQGDIVNQSVSDQTINTPLVMEVLGRTIDTGTATVTLGGAVGNSGGSFGLTKAGEGTLVLKQATTYGGATTINAGTLRLSDNGALPSGTAVALNNAATLELNGIAQTVGSLQGAVSTTLKLGAGTLTTGANNAETHIAGMIEGTGGLIKQGTNNLWLDNVANTYTGKTKVSGGRLMIKEDASLGAPPTEGPVADQLTLDGGTLMNSDSSPVIDANRGITLTSAGGSFQVGWGVAPFANRTITVNSAITGEGGLTMAADGSAGVLILNAINTYAGPTTINAGLVQVASLDNLGTGTEITFNGGGLQWRPGTTGFDPSTRTMTFQAGGAVLDTNGNDATLANAVGNNGPGGLTKMGDGVLRLAAVNTYQGPTTLAGGLVQVNSLDKLGPNTRINFTGGGLRWPESAPTFDPSVRTLNFQSGQAVLDTNGNDATLSKPVGNGGNGGLTKAGLGTLTLTGRQIYSGATNINAGTLKLTPLAAASQPETAATNVLHLDASVDGSYSVSPAGVATWVDQSGSGNDVSQSDPNRQPRVAVGSLLLPVMRFDGNDSLIKSGVGNLPTNSSPRTVVFLAGRRDGYYAWWWGAHNDNNCFAFDMSPTTRVVGWNRDFTTGFTASAAGDVWSVVYNGGLSAGGNGLVSTYKNGAAGNTGTYNYTTGTENLFIGSWTDQLYNLNGDIAEILVYDGALSAEERQAVEAYLQAKWTASLPCGTAVNIAAGGTLDLNGATQPVGSLSGPDGATVQMGGGTLIVGGANTDCTYSGTMSGAGTLVKTGAAALMLGSQSSPFTGKTVIAGGQIRITSDGSLGAAPASPVADQLTLDGGTLMNYDSDPVIDPNRGITLSANGGRLQAGYGKTLTVNGVISGSGPLTVAQDIAGTVVLGTANTYTGDTRVVSGTLQVAHSLALQKSTLDMNAVDGGTVDFNGMDATVGGLKGARDLPLAEGKMLTVGANDADTTYSGMLTGFGGAGLAKTGNGTLTLTAAQNYSGPTVISGGTLKLEANKQPGLVHRWSFNDGTGRDSMGTADLTLSGSGASIADGQVTFNNGYARTATLNGENLTTKTLVVWTRLANLTQAGGGALNVETSDGSVFDAIVYNERMPNQWMAGSDYWRRSPVGNGGPGEDTAGPHMIAIAYGSDNSITLYRDGVPYGTPYVQGTLQTYSNSIDYLLGQRHWPLIAGSNKPYYGSVDEARVYNIALTAEQIAGFFAAGPDGDLPLPSNLLPLGTALSMPAAKAILELNGISQEIASLTGAAKAEIKLGGATLTVGGDTSPTDPFAGAITGPGRLNKKGLGTLTLSGINTYDGGTTVEAGTLVLANAAALLPGSSLSIAEGGTVVLSSGLSAVGGAGAAQGSAVPVPEPGTLVLLTASLAGLIVAAWRKNKKG